MLLKFGVVVSKEEFFLYFPRTSLVSNVNHKTFEKRFSMYFRYRDAFLNINHQYFTSFILESLNVRRVVAVLLRGSPEHIS